jgi:hypothetical protein
MQSKRFEWCLSDISATSIGQSLFKLFPNCKKDMIIFIVVGVWDKRPVLNRFQDCKERSLNNM